MSTSSLRAWQPENAYFPVGGTADEKMRALVHFAVLAPSQHNAQPWSFVIRRGTLELHADYSRRLPVVDPADRELYIGCGAALEYLCVAARRDGLELGIDLWPDADQPGFVARVYPDATHPVTARDRAMFEAGFRRHTNRQHFEDRPLPAGVADELVELAREYGVSLYAVAPGPAREQVADLVSQAEARQAADPAFRGELSHWIRSGRSDESDGLPAATLGVGVPMPRGGGAVMARLVSRGGSTRSGTSARAALESPALVVLATESDSRDDWLATGAVLARIGLHITVLGLSLSYFNEPVEVGELRPRLAELACPGYVPQLMIRLGFGPAVQPTPRRSAGDVIA